MNAIARHLLLGCGWIGLAAGCCLAQAATNPPAADPNLIQNGGFEQGTPGWIPLWTRDGGSGKTALDTGERHGGSQCLRIEVTGDHDWSLSQIRQPDVKPGDLLELTGWVRLQGNGTATLGVVTRDANNRTLDWSHGGRSARETKGWIPLRSRFIVPPNTASIQCRLIGEGAATVWIDDVALTRQGNLTALREPSLPPTLTVRHGSLTATLHTANGSLEIRDQGGTRAWTQRLDAQPVVVLDAKATADGFDLRLLDPASTREIAATVRLDGGRPECVVKLKAAGAMEEPLQWPVPFVSAAGQRLILPVNEGISYPADDSTLPSMKYHLYGGHGLCMPWYGATDGTTGWMAIVETADDAAVGIPRLDGLLSLAPEWQPQLGNFGTGRVIRYIFFQQGGHVAMAKRYREYAQATGLFKTLADKCKAVPAVDLLVGAVNVWCWDKDAPAICRSLREAGIRRILWSNQCPPAELKALNDMGVLTSRYDIYQDAMNPAEFSQLSWIHPDWTAGAWANDDLMTGPNGDWIRGWEVETRDGKRIPCGTLCDRQAVPYAKARIPAELATHPYRCRFLDTTTASPWRECYHPKHPMTRTESKQFKMELLRYVSGGCGLVCGSETGHDAAVPYADYFEGMLSLGPYRVPDSGRDMARTWDEVPDQVAKFQTGHAYRLPLWELVYHDCVVAQWYWGDYNNKLPKLWDRRDLWNALYGTPPMFMFNRRSWEANKDRFVKSYQTAIPVARATGYTEMLSHEWLTDDRAVQRTRFANNVVVTVNFGDSPYGLPDGTALPPLGLRVTGIVRD